MRVRWVEKSRPEVMKSSGRTRARRIFFCGRSMRLQQRKLILQRPSTSSWSQSSHHCTLNDVALALGCFKFVDLFPHQPNELFDWFFFLFSSTMCTHRERKRWTGYCIEWWTRNFNELHDNFSVNWHDDDDDEMMMIRGNFLFSLQNSHQQWSQWCEGEITRLSLRSRHEMEIYQLKSIRNN